MKFQTSQMSGLGLVLSFPTTLNVSKFSTSNCRMKMVPQITSSTMNVQMHFLGFVWALQQQVVHYTSSHQRLRCSCKQSKLPDLGWLSPSPLHSQSFKLLSKSISEEKDSDNNDARTENRDTNASHFLGFACSLPYICCRLSCLFPFLVAGGLLEDQIVVKTAKTLVTYSSSSSLVSRAKVKSDPSSPSFLPSFCVVVRRETTGVERRTRISGRRTERASQGREERVRPTPPARRLRALARPKETKYSESGIYNLNGPVQAGQFTNNIPEKGNFTNKTLLPLGQNMHLLLGCPYDIRGTMQYTVV